MNNFAITVNQGAGAQCDAISYACGVTLSPSFRVLALIVSVILVLFVTTMLLSRRKKSKSLKILSWILLCIGISLAIFAAFVQYSWVN